MPDPDRRRGGGGLRVAPGAANPAARRRTRGVLLLLLPAGVAALAGCLAPDPGFGPWSKEPEQPVATRPIWRLAPRAEAPPAGRAWLTVASLAVTPETVRRDQPFAVRLRVRNGGERASGAFKTDIQANLDGAAGVVAYPLASEGRLELAPGASAEFVVVRAEGLPRPGVYAITAGLQVVDLALVESTDYVDADMPAARLVVE